MLTALLMIWLGATPPSGAPVSALASARDSVTVNRFMWYDAGARTVHIQLTAAFDGNNGGMNFNGASKGGATIAVPVGWKAAIVFVNRDAIPHSAIVIADRRPLPAIVETPAFGGAYTAGLTSGLGTDATDTMNFTASQAGQYILVCGVPGHGASGMWIRFDVQSDAKTPAYTP